MDPSLTAALIACGTGAVSAFIAYWWGFTEARRQDRVTILRLKAQMHEMHTIGLDLADALYRIKTGDHARLTARERAAFTEIENNLRKDAS